MRTVIRSIRFRLTLWFVFILAIIMAVASGLLYLGVSTALTSGLDNTLRDAARRSVLPPEETPAQNADPAAALLLIRNAPARLLSLDGRILQTDPAFPSDIPVDLALLQAIQTGEERIVSAGQHRLLTAPVRVNGERVAAVQTAIARDDTEATLASLRQVLLVLLPASLALAALGGGVFASRALAPMNRVRREVEQIEATSLGRRVSAGMAGDEIGALAGTFDGLLDRIEHALTRERQFTSDASHELRSPLAVLKAEIGAALSRPRSTDEYQRTLRALDGLTDELATVVDDLLTLARAANHPLKREPLDLAELAIKTGVRYLGLAQTRGLTLTLPEFEQTPLMVSGDALKLSRVITNLLDNALRYTPAGGSVTLRLIHEPGRGGVEISDTGPGIAPEHLAHLFERFYRVDSGRARDSGGTGLGLSIVKAIVDAHGGEIIVRSTPGAGSTFGMRLEMVAGQ
jgi:heavy metal sensor kinase